MPEEKNDIYYKLGEIHGDVKSILVEAKRTNGRVTKIENQAIPELHERIDGIDLKLAKWAGVIAVILFLIQLFGNRLIELV